MPQQKPGKSKQNYQTPPEFLAAVKKLLHITDFTIDLAASSDNKVCEDYYCEADNSLVQPWSLGGWNWCNPPYSEIAPWVKKAAEEAALGAHTAMLIPASVGANWWSTYVTYDCYQLFLNGRLTFVGCDTPYPKDCALLLYTPMYLIGNKVWSWNE